MRISVLDDALPPIDDDRRLDQDPRPAPTWQVWLETAALAALATAAGVVADAGLPWLALAPLLAGLRYGSGLGIACAAAQTTALIAAARWSAGIAAPAAPAMLGWLVAGLVTGQFRDAWTRRLRRLETSARDAHHRLGGLARAYHLLAASHDRLERELPGTPSSLRDALEAFSRGMAAADPDGLEPLGGRILNLFRLHAAVRAATLHPVDVEGRVGPPVAALGIEGAAAAAGTAGCPGEDDPIVRQAVCLGEVVSVRDLPEAAGTLVAVPLVDIVGRVHAVIAVRELPFLFLHDETLALFAVLGGHLGDLLTRGVGGREVDRHPTRVFCASVSRSLRESRRYGIPAALAIVELESSPGMHQASRLLARCLAAHRRVTDEAEIVGGRGDGSGDGSTLRILVLLKLADAAGLASYLARIESLARVRAEELGAPCLVRVGGWSLDDSPLPTRPREIEVALAAPPRIAASSSEPPAFQRHHGITA